MKPLLIVCALFMGALVGCPSQQSPADALQEMCNLPDALESDPSAIGPYLEDRVTNAEMVGLLETMESAEDLYAVLREHGVDPQSCDLVTALGPPQ